MIDGNWEKSWGEENEEEQWVFSICHFHHALIEKADAEFGIQSFGFVLKESRGIAWINLWFNFILVLWSHIFLVLKKKPK